MYCKLQFAGCGELLRLLLIVMLLEACGWQLTAGENLPKLIRKVRPAVATVYSYDAAGDLKIQGTGFFIDKQGHLVTSGHVVHGAARIAVTTHDGRTYTLHSPAVEDPSADLALLSVSDRNTPRPLRVRKEVPEVGERVLVVGSPLGFSESVSDGIVSAVRQVPGVGTVLQMTAPISAGSSGSPVVNLKGEVVGVARSQREEGQNLNFAVPSQSILALESEAPSHRGDQVARK